MEERGRYLWGESAAAVAAKDRILLVFEALRALERDLEEELHGGALRASAGAEAEAAADAGTSGVALEHAEEHEGALHPILWSQAQVGAWLESVGLGALRKACRRPLDGVRLLELHCDQYAGVARLFPVKGLAEREVRAQLSLALEDLVAARVAEGSGRALERGPEILAAHRLRLRQEAEATRIQRKVTDTWLVARRRHEQALRTRFSGQLRYRGGRLEQVFFQWGMLLFGQGPMAEAWRAASSVCLLACGAQPSHELGLVVLSLLAHGLAGAVGSAQPQPQPQPQPEPEPGPGPRAGLARAGGRAGGEPTQEPSRDPAAPGPARAPLPPRILALTGALDVQYTERACEKVILADRLRRQRREPGADVPDGAQVRLLEAKLGSESESEDESEDESEGERGAAAAAAARRDEASEQAYVDERMPDLIPELYEALDTADLFPGEPNRLPELYLIDLGWLGSHAERARALELVLDAIQARLERLNRRAARGAARPWALAFQHLLVLAPAPIQLSARWSARVSQRRLAVLDCGAARPDARALLLAPS